jgi:hypothetical protein
LNKKYYKEYTRLINKCMKKQYSNRTIAIVIKRQIYQSINKSIHLPVCYAAVIEYIYRSKFVPFCCLCKDWNFTYKMRILVNIIRKSMLKLTTYFGYHDLFLKHHTNYTILDEYEWKQSTNLYISIWTDKNAMWQENSLHVL